MLLEAYSVPLRPYPRMTSASSAPFGVHGGGVPSQPAGSSQPPLPSQLTPSTPELRPPLRLAEMRTGMRANGHGSRATSAGRPRLSRSSSVSTAFGVVKTRSSLPLPFAMIWQPSLPVLLLLLP